MDTDVSEVTTLIPVAKPFEMAAYLDAVANDQAIEAQHQLVIAYDRAVRALVGPNDVQATQGREFKKKSAWRKLARYFCISTEIVREESQRDAEGHLISTVIVRAVAPWGQYAEAIAKCSTREQRFKHDVSKADHDCPATAQTRATNRAVSDLIAAGEVSAEEMEFGEVRQHAAPARPVPQTGYERARANPPAVPHADVAAEAGEGGDSYPPTEKQVAFFQRLAESPVFSEEERKRAVEWLATKATRQTIKDQIDWLKTQVEKRSRA